MPVNGYGPEKPDEKIYIREAAEALNRKMGTLRKWDQSGILPSDLVPQRGSRGWRYWTEEQVEGLQEWLRDTDRRPGKALPHYNPTEVQLDKAIGQCVANDLDQLVAFPRHRAGSSIFSPISDLVEHGADYGD